MKWKPLEWWPLGVWRWFVKRGLLRWVVPQLHPMRNAPFLNLNESKRVNRSSELILSFQWHTRLFFVLLSICRGRPSISPSIRWSLHHFRLFTSPLWMEFMDKLAAGGQIMIVMATWRGSRGQAVMAQRAVHVAMATTSQPWPWAEVRGERGVAAETRKVGNRGKTGKREHQARGTRLTLIIRHVIYFNYSKLQLSFDELYNSTLSH